MNQISQILFHLIWIAGCIVFIIMMLRSRYKPFTVEQNFKLDEIHAKSTARINELSRDMMHNPDHWARYGEGIRNNPNPSSIGAQNSEEAKAWSQK